MIGSSSVSSSNFARRHDCIVLLILSGDSGVNQSSGRFIGARVNNRTGLSTLPVKYSINPRGLLINRESFKALNFTNKE